MSGRVLKPFSTSQGGKSFPWEPVLCHDCDFGTLAEWEWRQHERSSGHRINLSPSRGEVAEHNERMAVAAKRPNPSPGTDKERG